MRRRPWRSAELGGTGSEAAREREAGSSPERAAAGAVASRIRAPPVASPVRPAPLPPEAHPSAPSASARARRAAQLASSRGGREARTCCEGLGMGSTGRGASLYKGLRTVTNALRVPHPPERLRPCDREPALRGLSAPERAPAIGRAPARRIRRGQAGRLGGAHGPRIRAARRRQRPRRLLRAARPPARAGDQVV